MSPVRHKTIRRKVTPGKTTATEAEKLLIIRALYIVVFNREESLLPYAVEFFHLLGSILEGTCAQDLQLTMIDPQVLQNTMDDLSKKD